MLYSNSQKAFAYQIKINKVKHAFILVINDNDKPVKIFSYLGTILKRAGTIYNNRGNYYFIADYPGARAKKISGKMSSDEEFMASLIAATLFNAEVPLDKIIKTLKEENTTNNNFINVILKGLTTYLDSIS